MPVRIPSRKMRAAILAGDLPLWLRNHPRKPYLLALYKATPDWLDRRFIKDVVEERNLMTALRGVEHVIDHIIPLCHPYVCGLNVPWNMQVLTRKQNAAKSNVWYPDQLELFSRESETNQAASAFAAANRIQICDAGQSQQ